MEDLRKTWDHYRVILSMNSNLEREWNHRSIDWVSVLDRYHRSYALVPFASNKCGYFSYPIFHLGLVISLLCDPRKTCAVADRTDERHCHLGRLEISTVAVILTTKDVSFTADISRFVDDVQINNDYAACAGAKPNTRWQGIIYRRDSAIRPLSSRRLTNHSCRWTTRRIE